MLGWAIAFFVAAIIVALLGMAEAATTFAVIAKVLFWVFLVGFCLQPGNAFFEKPRLTT